MDKESTRRLIKKTFQNSFNKKDFIYFIKNLLNQYDESKVFHLHGCYIPKAFKNFIKIYERVGTYVDPEGKKIDILIVYLKRETTIDRARTAQRNFIARYLKERDEKDAGLIAFVSPQEEDWRFSFVKMEYKFEKTPKGDVKVKEEFTPARRYSFLVGKNESSHTAQSCFVDILINDIHNLKLNEVEEAFNIETVTKEFFLQYRNLFIQTKEALDKVIETNPKVKFEFEEKGVNTVDFTKKLLGQIVFLYFLQKKGWFGVGRDSNWGTGSKHFLRELFEKKQNSYYNFFNDILEPLFYEALRVGEDRRHLDYYYSRFNCRIPFLNGGLFDPIGNYDWVHTDIVLSDSLFSNNISTKEGDTGNGILDIFDRYNFTVREDEPLEKEVAIDPELLGKAYEKFNAIRPDNFEEYKKVLRSSKKGSENKFNKQYGVYYTPREIVHYMCQQSLIYYLMTELNGDAASYERVGESNLDMFGNKARTGQLGIIIKHKDHPAIPKEDIGAFIRLGEQFRENDEIALIKEEQIDNGMQKSSTIEPLLPENIRKNASLIDEKLENITICDPAVGSGAFPVGMMNEIVRARTVLTPYLEDDFRTTYNFKRQCIEKSLYGVDIDPGAVEITKLRLWLSLIVEEEDFKEIKPLPNLDYKIVCGNSLLGYPYTPRGLEKIEQLKIEFFNETSPLKKNKLKDQVNYAIYSLYKDTNKSLGYKVNFDFKINFSEVFRKNNGFDVVIANPPYVSHISFPQLEKKALTNIYTTFKKRADLYVVFYEKGVQLLKCQGVLTYISPNKFFRSGYGVYLRNFLNKETKLHTLIDFGDTSIFETTTYPCIVILQREKHGKYEIKYADIRNTEDLSNRDMFRPLNSNVLSFNIWSFIEEDFQQLKEKMKNNSALLSEYVKGNFYRGVVTGLNRAFIITEEAKQNLLTKNPKISSIVKPYLMGRNVKRWYSKQTMYILYAFHGIEIEKYPEVVDYLMPYKSLLEKRATSKNHKWYELQQPQIGIFHYYERPKIISTDIAKRCEFTFDNSGSYIDATLFCLPIDDKYLLALLNSRLLEVYYKSISSTIRGGFLRFKKFYIEQLPIKITTESKRNMFIDLINKIFAITRDEDYMQNQQKQTKVKTLEHQIDQMVYKLYNLTPEEIDIVEGFKNK